MKQKIKFGNGWEAGLGDFYKKYYQTTLDNLGFDFCEKKEGPGMGAVIIFSGHGMFVQIINDKEQYFVSLGKEGRITKWWDLEFIMAYFKILDDNINSTEEKKREKILCDTFNWENYSVNAEYFSSHFERIKQLFLSDNYEDYKYGLENLADELTKYRKKRWNIA